MTGPATWLRGPAFVGVAVTLAVVAHVAGGEAAPQPLRVALVGLLAGLFVAASGAREQSGLRLFAALAGVQALSHLVLLDPAHPGLGERGEHVHGAAGPLVWAAHAVAAALLAAWLRRGEQAVLRAVARALHRLWARPRTTTSPAAVPLRGRPPTQPVVAARVRRAALPVPGRRGPPVRA